MRLDTQIIEVKLSDLKIDWNCYPDFLNNLYELKQYYCRKELSYGRNFVFFDEYDYYSESLIGEYLRTSAIFSILNNELFSLKIKLESNSDKILFYLVDCSDNDMLCNSGRENLYREPLFDFLRNNNASAVTVHYDNQIIPYNINNTKDIKWNQYVAM
jgi:hypothetical protein